MNCGDLATPGGNPDRREWLDTISLKVYPIVVKLQHKSIKKA